jgi:spore coat polysaccharide synthesis
MESVNMLINILKPDFIFNDDRGTLVQLVHEGYSQMNVVTSKKGVFRGGHYHKINREVFYIISGHFKFTAEKDGIVEEYDFKDGDMFEVLPYVIHSFDYLEDTTLVAMYDKGVELVDGGMDSYIL